MISAEKNSSVIHGFELSDFARENRFCHMQNQREIDVLIEGVDWLKI